jgi:hypothetical protein
MRGRARCCILSAFALAFSVQLAVVFVYLPSSSINSGLLLDESAFPAPPALRVSSKLRPAPNSSEIAALAYAQHAINAPRPLQNAPILHTPIVAFHHSTSPSIVVSSSTEKQALASSNLGPNYELVCCLPAPQKIFYLLTYLTLYHFLKLHCRLSESTLSHVPEAPIISCAL